LSPGDAQASPGLDESIYFEFKTTLIYKSDSDRIRRLLISLIASRHIDDRQRVSLIQKPNAPVAHP
jgi:hypothetical protein